MPHRILVIDDDPVTLNWLKALLGREDYAVETVNRGLMGLRQVSENPPDLLVLDLMLPDIDGLEILRRIRQDPERRDLWVIILSVKDRPEDIVTGLRNGADDYVPKRPGADMELISKIRGLLAQPKRVSTDIAAIAPVSGGALLSFCSAKGGTGTTSVCTNTAFALSQLEPRMQVLLVDLVFPLGTVGTALGYESEMTVARLSREAKGKLDRSMVEKYVSPVQRWGFRVLLGACDLQEATNLDVSQIGPLFEVLQTMYDYILVDFGRNLSRISLPLIQSSNAVTIIVTPDVSTVKLTRLTIEYLESLGAPRHRMTVVNNRTVGRVWISKEDTERELQLPLAGTIPYEAEYFTMATNAGVPFMAKFPDHAASLMFMDLARLLRERVKK